MLSEMMSSCVMVPFVTRLAALSPAYPLALSFSDSN